MHIFLWVHDFRDVTDMQLCSSVWPHFSFFFFTNRSRVLHLLIQSFYSWKHPQELGQSDVLWERHPFFICWCLNFCCNFTASAWKNNMQVLQSLFFSSVLDLKAWSRETVHIFKRWCFHGRIHLQMFVMKSGISYLSN